MWTGASLLLNHCQCPIRGGIGAQGAGAEILRVRPELVTLPLSACSPSGNGTCTLVDSHTGARGARAGTWCGLGRALGQSEQASQSPRLLPISCLHMSTANDCLHPVQRQVRSEALFFLSVHSPLGNSSLCSSGELCQSKRGWGVCWSRCGKPERAPGFFNLLPLPSSPGVSQVCVSSLHEQSPTCLQPSCQSHCFSKPPNGALFPGVGLQSRDAQYVAWTPHFPEKIPTPVISPPSSVSLQGVWVLTQSFLPTSYQTLCGSFFTGLVVKQPFCPSPDYF